MELKNIKIPEETWWKLNELKVKWRFKKISEVIEKLVKKTNDINIQNKTQSGLFKRVNLS